VPDLALLALTLFWGTSFLIVKQTLDTTSVSVFLSLRFAIAALTTGMVAVARRERPGKGLLRDGILLGLALSCGFILQTEGLRFTTPARSGFLTGLSVLFVPILERTLYGRAVPPKAWAGVVLALIGLAVLVGPFAYAQSHYVHLGDLLSTGCGVAFSFQIIFTGERSARHPLGLLTTVQLVTATVLSLMMLPFEDRMLTPTPAFFGVLAYCGIVTTTIAFLIQNWAQRRTTATRAAILFTLEPVVAALFSHLVGGEPLGVDIIAGGGLIVVGILVVELIRGQRAT
jgi:drug/metabolite transporter (DMT)-like permease